MVSADRIADYIIRHAHWHGDPITNLKLQKLLYYAQAWHLALHDRRLFREQLKAWVHGPVVPAIYHRFRRYGWQPILEHPEDPELPPEIVGHLEEVLEEYASETPYALERMTHQEDPWRLARGDLPPDAPSDAVIRPDHMRDYYRKLADGR